MPGREFGPGGSPNKSEQPQFLHEDMPTAPFSGPSRLPLRRQRAGSPVEQPPASDHIPQPTTRTGEESSSTAKKVTGEVIEGLEETAEVARKGVIGLLQRGIEWTDKHAPPIARLRKGIARGFTVFHEGFIDMRAQSMVDHPTRFYNRAAFNLMLWQTRRESAVGMYDKMKIKYPKTAKIIRAPLTTAEFISLVPAFYPLPIKNPFPFIPLPLFLNQMCTLIAVNTKKTIDALLKMKPLEILTYGAFTVLDLSLPFFNSYPVSPGIEAFVSKHYHNRRQRYIEKAKEKLAQGGKGAEKLEGYLKPRVANTICNPLHHSSEEELQAKVEKFWLKIEEKRNDLEQFNPLNTTTQRGTAEKARRKIPIVSKARTALIDLQNILASMRWEGKRQSVEELQALAELVFPTSPATTDEQ